MRIGFGYDVHKLVENRKLILGGVEIPYEKGLLGHSDADVLIHAVIDSIFGAAALRDIGNHFPDSDEKYKGVSSLVLLKESAKILKDAGYEIENIDSTIVAQQPKLAPHIPQMIKNMAEALGIDENRINVKGKTEENLGFTGSGEGVKSYAVCLINEIKS
ncbi:MAG: 2-C-methyl-D-erythritol 2,4-cyclodiphosphate synthase [Clostridia bacterium]|nr:2-C-methyl-D-erythritol 2,4-cyclodiphosphate synthase [Clostridia bacterium]